MFSDRPGFHLVQLFELPLTFSTRCLSKLSLSNSLHLFFFPLFICHNFLPRLPLSSPSSLSRALFFLDEPTADFARPTNKLLIPSVACSWPPLLVTAGCQHDDGLCFDAVPWLKNYRLPTACFNRLILTQSPLISVLDCPGTGASSWSFISRLISQNQLCKC